MWHVLSESEVRPIHSRRALSRFVVVARLADGNDGNYRFQKKEYAGIDIVKTEKKGFGVRARHDMIACVSLSLALRGAILS